MWLFFCKDAAEKITHGSEETSNDLKKNTGSHAHKQPHTPRQPCKAKVPFSLVWWWCLTVCTTAPGSSSRLAAGEH